MINEMSLRLSQTLVNKYPKDMPPLDVTRYSIKFILSNVVPILITIILGFIFGIGHSVLTFLLAFVSLRLVSGGFHFKSPDICFSSSIVFILTMSVVATEISDINYLGLVSLVLVCVYAPSKIKNKTRVKEDKHFIFKAISIFIVVFSLLLDNDVVTLAVLCQSLLLIGRLKGGERI